MSRKNSKIFFLIGKIEIEVGDILNTTNKIIVVHYFKVDCS